MHSLVISETRARKTITFEGLFDAMARVLHKNLSAREANQFERIARKAGQESVVQQITQGLRVDLSGIDPVELAKRYISNLCNRFPDHIAEVENELIAPLLQNRDAEGLERDAAAIAAQKAADPEAQANR